MSGGGPELDHRGVFVERFALLYAAAGDPPLKRVVESVARARRVDERGRPTRVSMQRLSDWRRGRNVPARFSVLAATLEVLIGEARKARPVPVTEGLYDLVAWRKLWERAQSIPVAAGYVSGAEYRPAQLPPVVSFVIGRGNELHTIEEHMFATGTGGHSPVVLIIGSPGVGKTTVALRSANDAADRYPDGTLFADLHGYSDSAMVATTDVLEQFLLALGIPGASIPRAVEARASLYRSVLRHRRVLVVMDNAASSNQVRALLPNSPGCCVLVTSRVRLSSLIVRHRVAVVSVAPLRPQEAVEVLRSIVGHERVAAEPNAAIELVKRCSCLPLALCVAAERVASRPQMRLADLVNDLANTSDQLGVLTATEDKDVDVRKVFSWSYRALDAKAARLFRALSLSPSNQISLEAAATLMGWQTNQTLRLLDTLVGTHLLQGTASHWYRFHDLIRVYAAGLNHVEDDEHDRRQAVDRLLRWYAASVHAASSAMAPYRRRPALNMAVEDLQVPHFTGWTDAVVWYERELPALTVTTRLALNSGRPEVAHDLPIALWDFFFLRKPWSAWISMNENGLAAARQRGDRRAEAWSLCNLGVAYLDLGDFEGALRLLSQSLELRRRVGARTGQGWSLVWLGNVHLAKGDLAGAAILLEQALEMFVSVGDRWAKSICRGYLGNAYTMLRSYDKALYQLQLCERTLQDMGDRQGEGCALDLMAKLHFARGEYNDAFDYLQRAIDLRGEISDRRGQADTLFTLGKVQQEQGHMMKARGTYLLALALFDDIGDPEAASVRDNLHMLDEQLARVE